MTTVNGSLPASAVNATWTGSEETPSWERDHSSLSSEMTPARAAAFATWCEKDWREVRESLTETQSTRPGSAWRWSQLRTSVVFPEPDGPWMTQIRTHWESRTWYRRGRSTTPAIAAGPESMPLMSPVLPGLAGNVGAIGVVRCG